MKFPEKFMINRMGKIWKKEVNTRDLLLRSVLFVEQKIKEFIFNIFQWRVNYMVGVIVCSLITFIRIHLNHTNPYNK